MPPILTTEEIVKLHNQSQAVHIRIENRRKQLSRSARREILETHIEKWVRNTDSRLASLVNENPKIFQDSNAMAQCVRSIIKHHPEWKAWVYHYSSVNRVYLVKEK